MRTRNRRVAVLFPLLALMAAACSPAGDAAENTTTTFDAEVVASTTTTEGATTTTEPPTPLRVWADEGTEAAVSAVAATFLADTGIPVEVEVKGFGATKNDTEAQAPIGEAADVIIVAHDWIGSMVADGLLEPIEIGALEDELLPTAVDAFTLGGQVYGVPHAVETVAFFFNTEMAPFGAPTNYTDLRGTCDFFGDEIPTCLGLPPNDGYHAYMYLASGGGYIFGSDDTGYLASDVGLDDPSSIAGLQFLEVLLEDGIVKADVDYATMVDLFANGEIPYMVTGPWAVPQVEQSGVPYGLAVLPTIEGNTAIPMVGVHGYVINAFSEQKAIAQTFLLDYLATVDMNLAVYENTKRPPANLAALDSLSADPVVKVVAESVANGHPMPNIPEMSVAWGPYTGALIEIWSGADAETALTTAAGLLRDAIASG